MRIQKMKLIVISATAFFVALGSGNIPAQTMSEMGEKAAPGVVTDMDSGKRDADSTDTKKAPKPPSKESPGPKPKPMTTEVYETGISAGDFVTFAQALTSKNESVKQIDPRHVAAMATSETQQKIGKLAAQIRDSIKQPSKKVVMHATLLSSADDDSTTESKSALELLKASGISSSDVEGIALPDRLVKLADVTMPISGSAENRALLTDRINLNYELRETPSDDFDVRINLTEKDKTASPFDASTARILMMNRFRAGVDKPVVLGVASGKRTTVLVIALKAAKD